MLRGFEIFIRNFKKKGTLVSKTFMGEDFLIIEFCKKILKKFIFK